MRRNRRQSRASVILGTRASTSSISLSTTRHASTEIKHIYVDFLSYVAERIGILWPRRNAESGLDVFFPNRTKTHIPIADSSYVRRWLGFIGCINVDIAVVCVEPSSFHLREIEAVWVAMEGLIGPVMFRHWTKAGKRTHQDKCKPENKFEVNRHVKSGRILYSCIGTFASLVNNGTNQNQRTY